jgi:hypothetical protein
MIFFYRLTTTTRPPWGVLLNYMWPPREWVSTQRVVRQSISCISCISWPSNPLSYIGFILARLPRRFFIPRTAWLVYPRDFLQFLLRSVSNPDSMPVEQSLQKLRAPGFWVTSSLAAWSFIFACASHHFRSSQAWIPDPLWSLDPRHPFPWDKTFINLF